MRIGTIAQHNIGHAAGGNLFAACRIQHNDLGIGLADIQNGNVFHGRFTAYERQA